MGIMKSLVMLPLAFYATAATTMKCQSWCDNTNLPGKCVSQAKISSGPCYTCGPYKTNSAEKLCDGVCADTSNDPKNCGSCENLCDAKKICVNGSCVKPTSSIPSTGTASPTVSKSSSKTSSTITGSKSASLFPSGSCGKLPTIPPRTYAPRASAGANYVYTAPDVGQQIFGSDYTPPYSFPNVSAAVPTCEQTCSSFAYCVGFAVNNFTDGEVYCSGWPEVYNASGLTVDASSNSVYIEIFDSPNWTPPADDLLPNGDFETGCSPPWDAGDEYGPGQEVNVTGPIFNVVPCGSDCKSGNYYAKLYYINTAPNAGTLSEVVSNQPYLTAGVSYTFSAWVKGSAASNNAPLSIIDTYPSDSFSYLINGTGEWELVSHVVKPLAGTTIEFVLQGTSLFDWVIDDVQFVPVS